MWPLQVQLEVARRPWCTNWLSSHLKGNRCPTKICRDQAGRHAPVAVVEALLDLWSNCSPARPTLIIGEIRYRDSAQWLSQFDRGDSFLTNILRVFEVSERLGVGCDGGGNSGQLSPRSLLPEINWGRRNVDFANKDYQEHQPTSWEWTDWCFQRWTYHKPSGWNGKISCCFQVVKKTTTV